MICFNFKFFVKALRHKHMETSVFLNSLNITTLLSPHSLPTKLLSKEK